MDLFRKVRNLNLLRFFLFIFIILATLNYVINIFKFSNDASTGILEIMNNRMAFIRSTCRKLVTKEENIQENMKSLMKHLVTFPEWKISWCLVPKVASTSISAAFLDITKKRIPKVSNPAHNYSQFYLTKVYPTMSLEIFEEFEPYLKSFLVVRHPFERLVSAFENKLINIQNNHDKEWFYKKYIKKIITNYRKKSNNSSQDTNTKSVRKVREKTKYEEPTFEEFINYLLDINVQNFDSHWKPISIICQICSFNYDYVLKYEYFQQEIQALIQHFKDTGKLPHRFKIPWDNKIKNRTKTKDRIRQYFRTLSKEKIQSLYNIYKTDFLFFGYVFDINEYV